MIDALTIGYHALRARAGASVRTRTALEDLQARRFARLARRVLARSPFYRPFAGRPLDAYPIVDKDVMMDAFDRINTLGLRRDELTAVALRAEATRDFSALAGDVAVGLSTGTSGRRGLFVASRAERLLWSGTLLAKAAPRAGPGPHRVALFLRANSRLYESVGASRTVAFRFYDLARPFNTLLDELEQQQPDVLVGPPHVLAFVAGAQREGRVRLALRLILAGGEVLEAHDERALREAFGIRVDQIYQATEGFLGITCARNVLHLNEEMLIVEREWLDRGARRFVPVVTDLRRSTQPIVRYRLDDVLVERAEPCSCGAPQLALERIEGRCDDLLRVATAAGELVTIVPDFVRDALSGAYPVIRDYRLVQHGLDAFELRLDAAEPGLAEPLARAALARAFARAGAVVPPVRVAFGIAPDLTRKARRIARAATVETAWARS